MTVVRRVLAVLMVVALAVTVLDVGADAHNRRRHRRHHQRQKTSREAKGVDNLAVTIDFEDREATLPPLIGEDAPDIFSGSITGFRRTCGGPITVEVFHAGGQVVGSTEATSEGSWALEAEDPGEGSYFARATRYGVGRGNRLICARGVSSTTAFTDESGGVIA